MLRTTLAGLALALALMGVAADASARPSRSGHSCSQSEWNKIPKGDIEACALSNGAMKCTARGYECCSDHGNFCEWSPYSSRAALSEDLIAPTSGVALPPRTVRPDMFPPRGPHAPPFSPPIRPPHVVTGTGPMSVAPPSRPTGPHIK